MSDVYTVVKVGIADLNIVKTPDRIRTTGLGSCVGVVIYDLDKQVAGMAHIMLPDSKMVKKKTNPFKYADTALDKLMALLDEYHIRRHRLKAKMAGGSQMFSFASGSDMMRIGERNVEAVKQKLTEFNIKIMASDTGGSSGRTIEFDPATGKLNIRTVNKGETSI